MMVLVFFTDTVSLETLAEVYIQIYSKMNLEKVTILFYNSNAKALYIIGKSILFAIQWYK